MHIIWKSSYCLALVSLFLGRIEASSDKPTQCDRLTYLPHLVEMNKWKKVCKILKRERNVSLDNVKKADQYNKSEALMNAVSNVEKIQKNCPRLKQPTNRLLQTALFLEAKLPKYIESEKYFISSRKSKLPYSIEFDPENNNRFILLDKKVGVGTKKVVTLGIWYNDKNPQIVARGTQKEDPSKKNSIIRELAVSKKMCRSPGIVESYSITNNRSRGKTYHSIFYSYYNKGSLQQLFDDGVKLTLKEKLDIARDILTGLDNLHSKGISHCDMGARNYLVNICNNRKNKTRVVKACIADLGRARFIEEAKNVKVQGNTSYTSPEGLFRSKMRGDDYLRADVYAVGCVLYNLFYGKEAPWRDCKYVKDKSRSVKSRYGELVRKINKKTKIRKRYFKLKRLENNGKLTIKEDFENLILRMVDPNPFRRGDAHQLKKDVELLRKRIVTYLDRREVKLSRYI